MEESEQVGDAGGGVPVCRGWEGRESVSGFHCLLYSDIQEPISSLRSEQRLRCRSSNFFSIACLASTDLR